MYHFNARHFLTLEDKNLRTKFCLQQDGTRGLLGHSKIIWLKDLVHIWKWIPAKRPSNNHVSYSAPQLRTSLKKKILRFQSSPTDIVNEIFWDF